MQRATISMANETRSLVHLKQISDNRDGQVAYRSSSIVSGATNVRCRSRNCQQGDESESTGGQSPPSTTMHRRTLMQHPRKGSTPGAPFPAGARDTRGDSTASDRLVLPSVSNHSNSKSRGSQDSRKTTVDRNHENAYTLSTFMHRRSQAETISRLSHNIEAAKAPDDHGSSFAHAHQNNFVGQADPRQPPSRASTVGDGLGCKSMAEIDRNSTHN